MLSHSTGMGFVAHPYCFPPFLAVLQAVAMKEKTGTRTKKGGY